ncbi:MAG: SpoIVB peptidase [bacterium]|nr:SpoIVB peptidase [Bacillota bacterium]
MSGENRRKIVGVLLSLLIISISLTPQFKAFVTLPEALHLLEGETQNFYIGFPVDVYIRSDREGIINLNGLPLSPRVAKVNLGAPLEVEPVQRGEVEVELLFFGVPVKRMLVNVLPPVKVIPGGHSIGVLLLSHGVIVIGLAAIGEPGTRIKNPAQEAGITVGDTILRVNGEKIKNVLHLAELVHECGRQGEKVQIEYKRGDAVLVSEMEPVLCKETGRYRIGLYVRDGANGVGTLSFYHRESGRYGALGHVITDVETNQPLNVEEGTLVRAVVSGIHKGMKGLPGEKIGVFTEDEDILGDIEKNTDFGIFGTLYASIENPYYPEGIPVALASQVTPGPAKILTVLEEEKIEAYAIEIERVFNQNSPTNKGMVVKITDPDLIERTGGIIQGMSGSPIIKDNKLVGVVTHVFVNDPTRGYGVFAEWMLYEAGISPLAQARGDLRIFSSFLFSRQDYLLIGKNIQANRKGGIYLAKTNFRNDCR